MHGYKGQIPEFSSISLGLVLNLCGHDKLGISKVLSGCYLCTCIVLYLIKIELKEMWSKDSTYTLIRVILHYQNMIKHAGDNWLPTFGLLSVNEKIIEENRFYLTCFQVFTCWILLSMVNSSFSTPCFPHQLQIHLLILLTPVSSRHEPIFETLK